MRWLKIVVVLFLVLSCTVVRAEEKALIGAEGLNFPDLQGDVARSFITNEWLVGGGIDIYKYDMFSARFEALTNAESGSDAKPSAVLAIAPVVRFSELAAVAGGTIGGFLDIMNPALGVYGGYDVNNSKWDAGAMLTIAKISTDSVAKKVGGWLGIGKPKKVAYTPPTTTLYGTPLTEERCSMFRMCPTDNYGLDVFVNAGNVYFTQEHEANGVRVRHTYLIHTPVGQPLISSLCTQEHPCPSQLPNWVLINNYGDWYLREYVSASDGRVFDHIIKLH